MARFAISLDPCYHSRVSIVVCVNLAEDDSRSCSVCAFNYENKSTWSLTSGDNYVTRAPLATAIVLEVDENKTHVDQINWRRNWILKNSLSVSSTYQSQWTFILEELKYVVEFWRPLRWINVSQRSTTRRPQNWQTIKDQRRTRFLLSIRKLMFAVTVPVFAF